MATAGDRSLCVRICGREGIVLCVRCGGPGLVRVWVMLRNRVRGLECDTCVWSQAGRIARGEKDDFAVGGVGYLLLPVVQSLGSGQRVRGPRPPFCCPPGRPVCSGERGPASATGSLCAYLVFLACVVSACSAWRDVTWGEDVGSVWGGLLLACIIRIRVVLSVCACDDRARAAGAHSSPLEVTCGRRLVWREHVSRTRAVPFSLLSCESAEVMR